MNENNIGQDKFGSNFRLLELCCQKVAFKFGNGEIEGWKNSDYIQLSAQLRRSTKVHISENTLKRIFGKLKTNERYYPQKATRDALASFIGFRDWQEFETIQNVTPISSPVMDSSAPFPATTVPKSINRFLLMGIVSMALVLTVIWRWWPADTIHSFASLQCLNPNGHSPHSAIFKLLPIGKESLALADYSIQFDDWKGSRSRFRDSTLTHYYELPGVYFPVLLYKEKIVDQARIYLETKGWEVTAQIQGDTTRVYPILLPENRNMDIPPSIEGRQIFAAGVDTLRTFYTNYAHIQRSDISADNMSIQAHITTSKERAGVRCSQVDITIYGEDGKHYLSLMKPECTAWSSYKFSEKTKSGRSGDLRALGHDLSQGGLVKITIIDKHVSVYINEKRVFDLKYEKPIGKIYGINFMFSGIGEFADFRMENMP